MSSIQTLRAVLVAGAVLAGIIGVATGQWIVVAYMGVAVLAHGLLQVHLMRSTPPTAERGPADTRS